jgi:signal peptidase II
LHLVKNTGSSFGLFPNKVILMIIISILFLGLLIWFRKEFKDCNLCYMFLIVGTLGNLIDRVFRGFVIDFFDLGWFPVFNLSDTIITLGVIGIVFALILDVEKDVIKKDEKIKK